MIQRVRFNNNSFRGAPMFLCFGSVMMVAITQFIITVGTGSGGDHGVVKLREYKDRPYSRNLSTP